MTIETSDELEHRAHEQAVALESDARRLNDVLLDLSVLNRDDLRSVFATIAESGAKALGVERVSLWQYDRERSAIICPAAWLRGTIVDEPLVITRQGHPAYWTALHSARTLAISDATTDDALAEIRDSYIRTNDIGAMLDSGVRLERMTFGIVCMEHIGGPRQWTAIEEQFVASLADRMGLAMLVDAHRRLEAQLLLAQKMEALGVMAGGIAHDFNNVLGVVLSASGNARVVSALGGDATEDFDAIDSAVQRATALTRKLLYISRQESIGFEVLDLNDVIRQFSDIAKRLVPASVRLQLLPSSQPLLINAERTFIDQALLNLCQNAVQAMPDGGSLTIATRLLQVDAERRTHGVSVPPGTYAHLRVLDTGSGIASESIARVFDPFYTTKGKSGTGLGLSVVYGGMRQHGGYVSVESVSGRGTVFHLFFRMAGRPDDA
ncbi:MAG: GAF domain-containing protein [Gemmatimonadaceae bacterium]|nr:GAF domain-containing protein [Gemmatimonadaceae bacterium]